MVAVLESLWISTQKESCCDFSYVHFPEVCVVSSGAAVGTPGLILHHDLQLHRISHKADDRFKMIVIKAFNDSVTATFRMITSFLCRIPLIPHCPWFCSAYNVWITLKCEEQHYKADFYTGIIILYIWLLLRAKNILNNMLLISFKQMCRLWCNEALVQVTLKHKNNKMNST